MSRYAVRGYVVSSVSPLRDRLAPWFLVPYLAIGGAGDIPLPPRLVIDGTSL